LNPAPIAQAVDVDYNDAGFAGFGDLKFKYFSLIGAKYYICDLCDEVQNQGYEFSTKIGKFSLFLNNSANPLIYSGQKTKNVVGRVDFLEKLRVVEKDTILVETTESELRISGEKPCAIEVLARSTILVEAQLNCTSNGIIVLNEYFDGNWRAYLDGQSLRVYQANINQNGVFAQPGNHKLEFKYQPTDFLFGSLISLLSSFLILLLFLGKYFLRDRFSLKLPPKDNYSKKMFAYNLFRNRRYK
jgi:uncharacterized membrane protein YfhO